MVRLGRLAASSQVIAVDCGAKPTKTRIFECGKTIIRMTLKVPVVRSRRRS